MNKLKSAVLYEYLTKVRAIGIFYLIQYLIVALIFAIVAICTEGKETGSTRGHIKSRDSSSMSFRPLKVFGGRKTHRDSIMQEKRICTLSL